VKTISIIIPVLNECAALEANLPLLQSWRQRGHELVVVDGGSTDQSLSICSGLVDHVLSAPAGRASQMNAGASVAGGDVLLFLHIDTMLPAILPQHLLNSLVDSGGKRWGRFDVRLSSRKFVFRVIETMMNLRSRVTGIATGDQAIFVERSLFEQLGGYPPIPLMEDVQLCKTLKHTAGRPVCMPERVQSSSRRWEKHGVVKTILLMWWLRLAYFLGARPEDLHAQYYQSWQGRPGHGQLNSDVRVLFFAKSPVAGKVKTRFIPSVGEEGALALHRQLIALTWQRITDGSDLPVELWLSDSGHESWFAEVCDPDAVYLQQGQDLGQRMAHALNDALTRAQLVLVVGADCVSLDANYLHQAVLTLREGADLVIGPAEDGGYVLLGVKHRVPEGIFDDIDWGTDRVFTQTQLRLSRAGVKWQSLALRWDVDRPEDLEKLRLL
jgi:rSAM/selenodomain-associated transferase 2/rSAM/selenodomain-associated transferase 1